jgi:enediyne biosynthesis protein E4
LHFGVGGATMVDRLDIRWPSGEIETVKAIAAQQVVTVGEGAGIVESHTLK